MGGRGREGEVYPREVKIEFQRKLIKKKKALYTISLHIESKLLKIIDVFIDRPSK